MTPEEVQLNRAYLQHLTDHDLALLLRHDRRSAPAIDRSSLLHRPGGLADLLDSQDVFDAVFEPGVGDDPLLRVSPFLAFAVAVHRAGVQLGSATHVPEWMGIGRRAPIFDVPQLRQFLLAPWRRLFLAELLASYTHVASGSVVVATRRGFRRQRFSELDPVRLAGLLEVVPDAERAGVLRRLGDLALFLTGVFPDYVARRGFGPIEESRLLRSGGLVAGRHGAGSGGPALRGVPGDGNSVGLLEELGRRWYKAAFDFVPRPVPASISVLGDLPERFGDARRIIALVTEQFLFRHRERWFGSGAD